MNRIRAAATIAAMTIVGLGTSAMAQSSVGYMELEGGVVERQMVSGLFLSEDMAPTLRDVIASFDDAAGADLDGFVIRVKDLALTSAQIEEIGRAIHRLRDSGATVHMFTEIYGPGEMLLASHVDEAIIQSGGAISVPGIYMQEMFLADALKSIGVQPDYIQVGDYKGASEMMANSEPSKAWEQNISQLLDGLYAFQTETIAEGRGMSRRQLEAAMKDCFFATDDMAVSSGMLDVSMDRLSLTEHIEEKYGEDFKWNRSFDPSPGSDMPDFASMGLFEMFGTMMEMFSEGPRVEPKRDTIAIVHIDGAIVDGESSQGGLLGGATVGSRTIRKALKEIEESDRIKGVIVRINSPGGSAIASESIWLGLQRVAETRPVWVSVGDMAASGGYYIAVAGDRIYVNESSIVGSIGVVGGKLAMRGLFEKLHINVVERTRGPRAGAMGGLDPWDAKESAAIRDRMKETYDLFVDRVKAGRRGIDIDKTAEGRLFVGDKAIALMMADEIGGVTDAIDDLASELGLVAGAYDVMDYPGPLSFEEMINGMFPFASVQSPQSSLVSAPIAATLRELVGPAAWPGLCDSFNAIMQLRDEPVLLTSPRVLIFE